MEASVAFLFHRVSGRLTARYSVSATKRPKEMRAGVAYTFHLSARPLEVGIGREAKYAPRDGLDSRSVFAGLGIIRCFSP